MDILGGRPRIEPDVRRRIGSWARELLQLAHGATVSVQELRCAEPNCPDVETVVLIGFGAGRAVQHKIRKPAVKVTREDLTVVLQPLRSTNERRHRRTEDPRHRPDRLPGRG